LNPDGSLLLESGATFAVTQKMACEQGVGLPITPRMLWKRVAEKGLQASRDHRGYRNTTCANIAGERKTVVHLIAGLLCKMALSAPTTLRGGKKGDIETEDGADSAWKAKKQPARTATISQTPILAGRKGRFGPFSKGYLLKVRDLNAKREKTSELRDEQ
jgi:hypothetical protein